MRKIIADRMVKSRQTSAHVITFFEADFSGMAKVRENQPLTYLPFVIHAVTRAIRDVPMLNSSWGEPGIIQKRIFMSVLQRHWRMDSLSRSSSMPIGKG